VHSNRYTGPKEAAKDKKGGIKNDFSTAFLQRIEEEKITKKRSRGSETKCDFTHSTFA